MKGYLYILKSLKNGKYYIGSTDNLERRLIEHNSGSEKSKFTKNNRPFELVFSQEYESLKIARKIEYKLKSFKSRKIIEEIIKDGICNLKVG
jgi:putative endonuclease